MIPEITHELGKNWPQPSVKNIVIDDVNAVLSPDDFAKLLNYSTSIPTGVYPGKIWKAETTKGWLLRWYGPVVDGKCKIEQREIILA